MAATEFEVPAFPVLFQSISTDLKNSQQIWDGVAKSASKVAVQLMATAVTLNSFIEQVQLVGDSANNIRGASRDIGASLTRFCMRQRAIENHMRSLSNSLTNQFCESMEKKSDEWKKRVTDIERRRSKCYKKTKSKKHVLSNDVIADQKEGCLELLFEQRNQFSFFVNAILPVLDVEVNLLAEGEHVKQVRDHLDQMVNSTDAQLIVFNSMDDFCLNSERRMISPAQSIISSATSGGLDRTMSPSIDSFYSVSRNSTISSYGNPQRPGIPGSFVYSSPVHSRPPLPRHPEYQGENTPRGTSQTDATNGFSMSAGIVANTATIGRRSRPVSFSGDSGLYNEATLKMINTPGERSSASLIAETLQQIDKLGVELDSYCMTLHPDSSSGVGSSVVSSGDIQNVSPPSNSSTPIPNLPVFRPSYQQHKGTVKGKKPPPPERRNSTIQTATSAAPSIADLRIKNNGEYAQVQYREPPKYPQGQSSRPPPPPFPGSLYSQQRK